MSVIIRLQNLTMEADARDIRELFQGLAIPEGGVHIVGGVYGDAFIAFSTDEDARQAMMMDGKILKGEKVRLLLSSRTQMYQVIEEARKKSQQQLAARGMLAQVPQVSNGPSPGPGLGGIPTMVAAPLLPVKMPSQVPSPAQRSAPVSGMLPSTPEQLAALMTQMAGMPGMETVLQNMPALAGLAPRLMQSMGHPIGSSGMGPQSMSPHSAGPHSMASHSVGPHSASPHSMGPHSVGPHSMGPHSVGPHSAGPHSAGPHSAGPHSAGPHSAGPHSAGPHSFGPHSMGSHATGPHSVGPHSVGPHSVGPHSVGPHSVGPHSVGPHSVGPHPMGPHPMGPHSMGPHSMGPHSMGPHSAGPHSMGPHSAGPHSAGPHSSGHHSAGHHSAGPHSAGPHSVGLHSVGSHAVGPQMGPNSVGQPMGHQALGRQGIGHQSLAAQASNAPNIEDIDSRVEGEKKNDKDDSKRGRDRRERSRSRDRKDRKRSHRSRDRSRDRDRDRDRDRSRDRGRRRRRSRSRSRDRRRESREARESQKDAPKSLQQPLLKTPEVGPDGKWSNQPSQLLAATGAQAQAMLNAVPGPQDHDSRGPMAMPPQAMMLGMQPMQDIPRGLGQLWTPENSQPDTDSRTDDRNRHGPEGMMDFFGSNRRGVADPMERHFNGPAGLARMDGNGDLNAGAMGLGMERLGGDPRDGTMLGPLAMDHERLAPGLMDGNRMGPGMMDRMGPGPMDRDRPMPGMLEGDRNGPLRFERDIEERDDLRRMMFDRGVPDMGCGPGPGFDRGGMDMCGPGMLDQGGLMDSRQGPLMEHSLRGRGFLGRGGPRGRGMRGMMHGRLGRADIDDQIIPDGFSDPDFRGPEEVEIIEDGQNNRHDRSERHEKSKFERERDDRDRRGRDRHSRDRDRDRYRDRHRDGSSERRRRSGRDDDRRSTGKDEFGRDLDLMKRGLEKDSQGLCIEIRNMSTSVSFADVRRFFTDLMIPGNGLKLINDSKGFRTGIGYVRFAHNQDYEAALRMSGTLMKNEVVEIRPISQKTFDTAVDSFLPDSSRDQFDHEDLQGFIEGFSACVRCDNLPAKIKEEDVRKLFGEYQIEEILMASDGNGQRIAYMKLEKEEDAKSLLSSHMKINTEGCEVKLSPCPFHIFEEIKAHQNELQLNDPHESELKNQLNLAPRSLRDESPVVPINTDILLLKNLPPSVRDRDITDFFSDVGLMPGKIHILLNPFGKPIGEAFCEFQDGLEAAKGLRKDNTHMGKFIVNVKPVPRPEMGAVLGDQTNRHMGPNGPGAGGPSASPGLAGHMGVMPRQGYMMHPRMMGPGVQRYPLLGQGPQSYPPRLPIGQGLEEPALETFGKPGCVIGCDNIPFRAGVADILAFFDGFDVKEENIIRKFNERNTPMGEARIAFKTPQEAQAALQKLKGCKIFNRPIWMTIH